MKTYEIRALSTDQVQAFDVEYVTPRMWADIERLVNQGIKSNGENFSFLDIGGGIGVFSDGILSRYPASRCWLIDSSTYLLNKNRPNHRKVLVEESAENIEQVFAGVKFDLIFMNWVLHHFVKGSYSETMNMQLRILEKAAALLNEKGRVIVMENLPEGVFGEAFCSFVINRVTSSKLLAPIVKRMGGNTAGVGICFLGQKQWTHQFGKANLAVKDFIAYAPWALNAIKKGLLTIRDIRVGVFALEKNP